jgi:hypothetical protein
MHIPARWALNTAQNSFRSATHVTSICHGDSLSTALGITTVVGSDQCTPSVDFRNSTVVRVALHPSIPEFTDHIIQSPLAFRTTVGDTAK